MTPLAAFLLIAESILGALIIVLVSALIVGIGAWTGFAWVLIVVAVLYIFAKLVVLNT